jgi:phosphoribosylformimino-5-aminoimidazole carboxamide ribotide isomerase
MSKSPVTFTVLPAIDVLDGTVVRLREGKRDDVTIRGDDDPAVAAARFAAEGARYIHLIDLNGAFSGTPSPGLVERVTEAANAGAVPVQVGGGYRDLEAIEAGIAAGASRVMVGTAALASGFLEHAVDRFGERLVVTIDIRDGKVATKGWTEGSDSTAAQLAARCAAVGVARVLVTNTHRDGTMTGPDLALLSEVLEAGGLPVIAAGGIASLDDLRAVRDLGCEGAIAGSALWLGRFSLAEALAL